MTKNNRPTRQHLVYAGTHPLLDFVQPFGYLGDQQQHTDCNVRLKQSQTQLFENDETIKNGTIT